MPFMSHTALIEAVIDALASSGQTVMRLGEERDPVRFLISDPSLGSFPLWVYVRNLTPGDRTDPDEYRIQLPGRILPIHINPHGPTLLLGYHSESGLFVGFDARTISTGARTQVSCGYVSLRTVKRARHRGITFDRDRRDRIAVGLRPEMIASYCIHASDIHAAADENQVAEILSRTAAIFSATDAFAFDDELLSSIAPERQRMLKSFYALAREAGFRRRVLDAYTRRCAISGVQLGIVEAAHILPVCCDGSTDQVNNGLSLLPQFHRAYDSGLIYLSSDYVMRVNEVRAERLRELQLDSGLEALRRSLGRISLPRSRRHWPDRALIGRGNDARGIIAV